MITFAAVRVLIDYRAALRQRSGVGEYTHELIRALLTAVPRDLLDITLFSSSWKNRLAVEPDLAGAASIDRRIPVRLLNLAWHRLEWPSAERLTGRRFDVTHSAHPLMLPSRLAARVITIHDLGFLSHPEWTHAEIRRDYPALTRLHAHRADHIIVNSRFTRREVEQRLDIAREKITVCSPGAPDWPPRLSAPVDGYVLFVGTLEPRKNVGVLLDAYERLAARRQVPTLVLAGRATEHAQPWLDRLGRPPLHGVVRHVGYVGPASRRSWYEGARLLVQPSFHEGFGIPVLEAMTLGVPVVAADRGALPEVLGDAGSLVDAADPNALATAIERMLDDEAYATAAAERGVRRSQLYRWDVTARHVYGAYQRAVEHRRCASA